MRRTNGQPGIGWLRAFAMSGAIAAAAMLSGCGGQEAPAETDRPEIEPGPAISSEQASEAISDAMLVASRALYLAINEPSVTRTVATEDGRLRLEWSEDASFLSGAGTYLITLNDYTIDASDPFSRHSYGYVFTGTIRLYSETGTKTEIDFNLSTTHAEPQTHPARTIRLSLSGFASESADAPDARSTTEGTIVVNGRSFTFEELAASF